MYHNSVEALIDALTTELIKFNDESNNSMPKINARIGFLMNGLRSCSVQLICSKGCSLGIEGFGDEAEGLYQTALTFRNLLENASIRNPAEYYCKLPTT